MSNKAISALLAVLLGLSFLASVWVQSNITPQFPSDLDIYMNAGQKALQKKDPYQPFEIGASLVYPPTALLVFAPLSILSYSREIWLTINIISLLLVLSTMLRMIPSPVPPEAMIWLTAGALLYAPFLEQLAIGQINSLVLLAIVVYMLGVSNPRHKWIGDCGLALAIATKISPVVLLAFPLIYRDWQRCIRIFVCLFILITISIMSFGLTPWLGFWAILPKLLQGFPGMLNQAVVPSINWLTSHFVADADLSCVGHAFSVLVIILWISTLVLRRNKATPAAILSFGIVGMTVGSTLIWYHHLVFLLAPIIFFMSSVDVRNQTGKVILFLLLLGGLLINTDRPIETAFAIPPLASIAGYLAVYLASGLSLYTTSLTPTAQQGLAADSPAASRHVSS